jgi:hypothetical protein
MPAKPETPHEPRVPGGKTDEVAPPKKPFPTPGKNMSEPAPHVGTDGHDVWPGEDETPDTPEKKKPGKPGN